MKKLKRSHLVLIAVSLLILLGGIGVTAYYLFSNYRNVRLFKEAQSNFQRGDDESLALAEAQLLQLVESDDDNEAAYILLGRIAEKQKNYPKQVYYCHTAFRLNPLSDENLERYIQSLCYARYFDRLENFLTQQSDLSDKWQAVLFYAAGRNGSIGKYKNSDLKDQPFAQLASLLFIDRKLSNGEKLAELKKFSTDDDLLQQEIFVAEAELFLSENDLVNTEKSLEKAYELNQFAFAPALGRFYANFRSFGKALTVFENYLAKWHDPVIAMQAAEIYCLLRKNDKIAELRKLFQSDSGNMAMLCCYYFDALTALVDNDMDALKELSAALRKNINTPLASFMFLCVDLQGNDFSAIQSDYKSLIAHRSYLDLQERADDMISAFLKNSLSEAEKNPEQFTALVQLLHDRKPEVFTAKYILLEQKKRNAVSIALLKDSLERFGNDQGIIKIAIEYFLEHEPAESERLISGYKQKFPQQSKDMLRYEVVLAAKRKDFDRVSKLFMENFSPEIMPEYWTFASVTMRENDLIFLSRDKVYEPFCKALLLLKKKEISGACDILEKADASGNLSLLFFAAKTLGENGRNQAALAKYAQFPEKSPWQLAVLLNSAELFAENGNLTKALDLSKRAYDFAPDMPETQLCYADKLYKNGHLSIIPDVVKLSAETPYRRQMKELWISGMQQRIKECDINTQQEKLRQLCRQLLVIDPDNSVAVSIQKQLNKMPQ